ncbi:MAG: hypothetical protein WCH44_16055 [Betaproteobacteria bacterium]
MSTPKIARHIAKRLAVNPDATAQNAAQTLGLLADQVDELARTVELINTACARLAKEREKLRLEITELKAKKFERRSARRS